MDQKGHKIDQKRLKYMTKGFLTKSTCFLRNLLSGILGYLENPDSFEIIRKIGNHLGKFGQI